MRREIVSILIAALGLCAARAARAQDPPVVAAIDRCNLNPVKDASGEWGGGAREEHREIIVDFAYWRRDPAHYTVDQEIAATQSVELCYARVDPISNDSEFVCPWSDSLPEGDKWLVYDADIMEDVFPPTPANVTDTVKAERSSPVKRIREDLGTEPKVYYVGL